MKDDRSDQELFAHQKMSTTPKSSLTILTWLYKQWLHCVSIALCCSEHKEDLLSRISSNVYRQRQCIFFALAEITFPGHSLLVS